MNSLAVMVSNPGTFPLLDNLAVCGRNDTLHQPSSNGGGLHSLNACIAATSVKWPVRAVDFRDG